MTHTNTTFNATPFSAELATALATIAATVRRATVQVQGRRSGSGSGVIWHPDGVVITNAHVVTGTTATVQLADGRTHEATVTRRNAQRDLVALRIPADELPTIAIADTDQLRVGELVLAVGNPWGLTGALTMGIIHSLGTTPTSRHWIQADIQLAPGNSGGPLVNAQGQVVGINTLIANGRGFAVPSNVIARFLHAEADTIDRPTLGITVQPVWVGPGRRSGVGLVITGVAPDSTAAQAQLQVGDILVGVRRQPFQSIDELAHILRHSHIGDGLALDVLRGHDRLQVDVVLDRPATHPQAA